MITRRHLACLALLCSATACDSGVPGVAARPPDRARARALLSATLESWKAGNSIAYQSEFPGARFVDEDQSAGWKLVDFVVRQKESTLGNTLNIAVDLTLRLDNKRGKQDARKTAVYQVALEPTPSVVRNDP